MGIIYLRSINMKNAKRSNFSLTSNWEKRHLPGMARALPSFITPDHLTILGIIASFIIAAGYILTRYSPWWLLLSNFGLFLHWYGDSLDGTLARVRKQERERYGYFVDHICDAFTVFIIALAVGLSPYALMSTALFVATGYYLMSIYVYLQAYTNSKFNLSVAGMGPTEFRIAVFLLNFVLIFWNPVLAHYEEISFTAFDLAGSVIGLVFLVMFIGKGIQGSYRLNKEEKYKLESISRF
jgi:archaetidylinositol phosphate synthase